MVIFFIAAQPILEHVYEELHKTVFSSPSAPNVGLCYTRSLVASDSQAKQLFATEESAEKKVWVELAKNQPAVVWIIGATKPELLAQVAEKVRKLCEGGKGKNVYYETREKTAVDNVVKLLTVDWKEKGNAFK